MENVDMKKTSSLFWKQIRHKHWFVFCLLPLGPQTTVSLLYIALGNIPLL